MNPEIRDFVESCDCILAIGAILSDINLGGVGKFTTKLDKSRIINIMPSNVYIGHANYTNLKMLDVLDELSKKLHKRIDVRGPKAKQPIMPKIDVGNQITADYLYASYANFFKPDDIIDDIIIVDSGTSFFGLLPIFLPKGSQFHSQALWSYRMGYSRFLRRLAGCTRSESNSYNRRRGTPDDCPRSLPVLPLWSKADHFCSE